MHSQTSIIRILSSKESGFLSSFCNLKSTILRIGYSAPSAIIKYPYPSKNKLLFNSYY